MSRHSAQILVGDVNLRDVRPGPSRSGLFARAVLEQLEAEPSVAAAAWATFFGYGRQMRYWRSTDLDENFRTALGGQITLEWFDATDAVFVAGRAPRVVANRPTEVVISASMAAQLITGGGSAVGVPLRIRNPEDGSVDLVEVVGVVADSLLSAEGRTVPMIYLPMSPDAVPPVPVLFVRAASPGVIDQASRAVRSAVGTVDPAVSFLPLQTLDDRLRDLFKGVREVALFGLMLGAVALLLAGTGLYALTAFMVRRRTREIGIRIAVGARPWDVVALVLRLSTGLTIAGALCGLAIAIVLANLMRAVLIGVSPVDPWAVAPTMGILLLVALAATAVPAYRAARVDPVRTLREA